MEGDVMAWPSYMIEIIVRHGANKVKRRVELYYRAMISTRLELVPTIIRRLNLYNVQILKIIVTDGRSIYAGGVMVMQILKIIVTDGRGYMQEGSWLCRYSRYSHRREWEQPVSTAGHCPGL